MEFKDRIKMLREEANMSITKLASEFEKSEAAIRAWEIGRTKPDVDTLVKLSQYFRCSTDYILGISDGKTIEKDALVNDLGINDQNIDLLRLLKSVLIDEDNTISVSEVFNALLGHRLFLSFLLNYSNLIASWVDTTPISNDDLDALVDENRHIEEKGAVIIRKSEFISYKLSQLQQNANDALEEILFGWGKPFKLRKELTIEFNDSHIEENENGQISPEKKAD